MATFLSTLYVLSEKLASGKDPAAAARGDKVVRHLESVSGCPLAALALCTLLDGRAVASLEKAALAAALFTVIKRLTARMPAEAVPDASAFEHSRAAFYYLLSFAPPEKGREGGGGSGVVSAAGLFECLSLECAASWQRLRVVLTKDDNGEQEQEQDDEEGEDGPQEEGGQRRGPRLLAGPGAGAEQWPGGGPGVARSVCRHGREPDPPRRRPLLGCRPPSHAFPQRGQRVGAPDACLLRATASACPDG